MGSKKIDVNSIKTGQSYYILVAKNQKVIKIHRIQNGINFEAHSKARQELSIHAFMLYDYLICHEQHRVWALSSKDVYEKAHLTERTYPRAVHELIEKDYLTKGTIDLGLGNRKYTDEAYHLWETPSLRESETPINDEVFKYAN